MSTDNSAPHLWPNIGAEENKDTARGHRIPRSAPTLKRLARLWSLLFRDGCCILPGGELPAWPAALGQRPATAAFPWLPDDRVGIPWLSTLSAAKELRLAGLDPVGPPPDVVREVSDKAWVLQTARVSSLLPACLAPLLAVLTPGQLRDTGLHADLADVLRDWPPWTEGLFTLKPRWGVGGRGRVGGRADRIEQLTARALSRLAGRGGAILEPWLRRTADLSAQVVVHPDTTVELIATTRQLLSPAGVYAGNRGLLPAAAGTAHDEAITAAAATLAGSAAELGFTGPAGIDSFLFLGPDGTPTLRPTVELNARFTTGTVALGLLARARQAGLTEDAHAWAFLLTTPPDFPSPELPTVALRLAEEEKPPILLLAPSVSALDAALASVGEG